jgi:hypothetical protein
MTAPSPTATLTTGRNATLADLSATLSDIRSRALDVVLPAKQLYTRGGLAIVSGIEPVLTEDGVTQTDGRYLPTSVADEGLASRLDIPLRYIRKCRTEHLGLYDQNVNGWLARDEKNILLRLVRNGAAGDTIPGLEDQMYDGVLRAVLSDRYKAIDNFDVMVAVLSGVQQAGVDPAQLTVKADLTERRMYLRIVSEQITANALALVRNYRDPSTGRTGTEYPLVAAGLRVSNSEVGQGGFTIAPFVTFLVCSNGQTMTRDADTKIHLGGKLEDGIVNWSAETQQAALRLATAKTADTVRTFMSTEYLEAKVREMSKDAGVEVTDPVKLVPLVAKRVGFTVEQATDILAAFVKGADMTAGGVMQAVTHVALNHPDGDVAAAMEDKAFEALTAAASIRV